MDDFQHIAYETDGRIATLTLNRPDRLNAIARRMPAEIAAACERAVYDDGVHAVIVTGAGRAFSAGYDLKEFAEKPERGAEQRHEDVPPGAWDPLVDFQMMYRNTQDFMALWRCPKPTIAKVRGFAVAGGSDIALCCDMVVMAEDARIGYPPARVWGCPTPAMWVYRLGPERAKRMLLTGDLITGAEAAEMGLILEAVPEACLDARVQELAERMAGVPRNQLMMHKLMINQAVENMGLQQTQMFATLFDGIARHSPEGHWFKAEAERSGFKEAVRKRDSGEAIAEGVSARTWKF